MKINNLSKFIISIAICELAGVAGSVFTMSAIPTWYATLAKPALNPPAWVFGPVWATLYFLMGISLWLVWKSDSGEKKKAIRIFIIQLLLNALWSPLFFGYHAVGSTLAVIVFLWVAIVSTILIFKRISKPAAALLIPYLLWVSFATYLNFALWVLN